MDRNKPRTPTPPPSFRILEDVEYVDPSGDEPSSQLADLLTFDYLLSSTNREPSRESTERGLSREQVFSRTVSLYAARLKHIAFKEEEESRLIIFDDNDLLTTKFRNRKSMLVPYVPFALGKEVWPLISRVVVGPSPHQNETIAAIMKMLGDDVEVRQQNTLPRLVGGVHPFDFIQFSLHGLICCRACGIVWPESSVACEFFRLLEEVS